MFPSISSGSTGANDMRFSPCTKTSVQDVIAAKAECLLQPDPCAFGGPCCGNDGKPLAQGTVCRNADPLEPCQEAATCTGDDGQCPVNPTKPDGAYCDRDFDPTTQGTHAVCHQGSCEEIHEGFCRAELGQPGCTFPGAECTRTCGAGRCIPFSSGCKLADPNDGRLYFHRTQDSCPIAPAGTPCVIDRADGQVSTSALLF